MPISEEEFKQALREAAGSEFDGLLPEEGGGHVFSERFERRMARHISSEAGGRRSSPLPGRLRPAAIAVILAAAMLAAACAIPKVRESVAGFFMQVFPDHIEVEAPVPARNRIDSEYGFDPVPAGFWVVYHTSGETIINTNYTNADNDVLTLQQSASPNRVFVMDKNANGYEKLDAGGKEVFARFSDYSTVALWVEDGYLFHLASSVCTDTKTLLSWIESVKPVE